MDDEMKAMLTDWDSSVADILENTPQAATMFVDPTGTPIGDTLQNGEGIAWATFDLKKIIEVKQLHDVVGYYNRFDVFNLDVNRRRLVPATFSGDDVPLETENNLPELQ
jgi:nitrilase